MVPLYLKSRELVIIKGGIMGSFEILIGPLEVILIGLLEMVIMERSSHLLTKLLAGGVFSNKILWQIGRASCRERV